MLLPNKRKYIGISQNELKNIGRKNNIMYPSFVSVVRRFFRWYESYDNSHICVISVQLSGKNKNLIHFLFSLENVYIIYIKILDLPCALKFLIDCL